MGVREIELRDIGSIKMLVNYIYERQGMKNKDTVSMYRFPCFVIPNCFLFRIILKPKVHHLMIFRLQPRNWKCSFSISTSLLLVCLKEEEEMQTNITFK